MSSTPQNGGRQSQLGDYHESLVVAAEKEPEWLAEFDDPVVERSGGGSKTMHAPDRDSDCVAPACYQANKDISWRVVEREIIDGWRDICGCTACEEVLGQ